MHSREHSAIFYLALPPSTPNTHKHTHTHTHKTQSLGKGQNCIDKFSPGHQARWKTQQVLNALCLEEKHRGGADEQKGRECDQPRALG